MFVKLHKQNCLSFKNQFQLPYISLFYSKPHSHSVVSTKIFLRALQRNIENTTNTQHCTFSWQNLDDVYSVNLQVIFFFFASFTPFYQSCLILTSPFFPPIHSHSIIISESEPFYSKRQGGTVLRTRWGGGRAEEQQEPPETVLNPWPVFPKPMLGSQPPPSVSMGFYPLVSQCHVKMKFLLMPISYKSLLWPYELQSI